MAHLQTVSSNLAANQKLCSPPSTQATSSLSGCRWLFDDNLEISLEKWLAKLRSENAFVWPPKGHYHISNGELYRPNLFAPRLQLLHRRALLSSCVNSRIFSDKREGFGADRGVPAPDEWSHRLRLDNFFLGLVLTWFWTWSPSLLTEGLVISISVVDNIFGKRFSAYLPQKKMNQMKSRDGRKHFFLNLIRLFC